MTLFPLTKYLDVISIIALINGMGFLITAITKTHKITDLLGAGSFVVASAYMTMKHGNIENSLLTMTVNVCVMIWGARLSGYLFYRILHTHEDKRLAKFFPKPDEGFFDKTRSNFPVRLSVFWTLQSLWAMILLIPVIYLNGSTENIAATTSDLSAATTFLLSIFPPSSSLTKTLPTILEFADFVCHFLGIAGMISGVIIESLADYQKYHYKETQKTLIEERKKKDGQKKKGKDVEEEEEEEDHWCDVGVWKYCRFPNYFGELLFWWSVYVATFPTLLSWYLNHPLSVYPNVSAVQTPIDWLWILVGSLFPAAISLLSPGFITYLLLYVSGIPLLVIKQAKSYGHRTDYQAYIRDTPLLIPGLPFSEEDQQKYLSEVERIQTQLKAQRQKKGQQQPSQEQVKAE